MLIVIIIITSKPRQTIHHLALEYKDTIIITAHAMYFCFCSNSTFR